MLNFISSNVKYILLLFIFLLSSPQMLAKDEALDEKKHSTDVDWSRAILCCQGQRFKLTPEEQISLRQAGLEGDFLAIVKLADYYSEYLGDDKKALEWLLIHPEKNKEIIIRLIHFYLYGTSATKDLEQAYYWALIYKKYNPRSTEMYLNDINKQLKYGKNIDEK